MSDSDSKDSDEGIRYKTESVRNKPDLIRSPKRSNRDSYNENKTRDRYRKRYYSRSPSPNLKEYKVSFRHHKKRKEKRSRKKSSSSSSDDQTKRSTIKISEKDKYYTGQIRENLQSHSKTKSDIINDNTDKNEIMGSALPPSLLCKQNDFDSKLSSHTHKVNPDETLYFAPKLPPHLRKDNIPEVENKMEDNFLGSQSSSAIIRSDVPISIGPNLPSNLRKDDISVKYQQTSPDTFGPNLPPNFMKNKHILSQQETENKTEDKYLKSNPIGPSLPPNLKKDNVISKHPQVSSDVFGPQAPTSSREFHEGDAIQIIGPSLPGSLRKQLLNDTLDTFPENNVEPEQEEEIYGPLPVGMSSNSSSYKALEERALELKINQLEPKDSNEPVRESWMIELPAAKAANFGLGPRQFRNRAGPDLSDRSSWTDLPGDKKKKTAENIPVDLKAEAEINELQKRDKEQEILVKKQKREKKSLLKMHKSKLKSKKKDDGPSERRPFSRDIDLQVNRFDDAQKKAILKKAQLLDNRFSSGKSKYL